MADRSLTFNLIGKDRSAGKTFDEVGNKAEHMGRKVEGSTGRFGKLGVVAQHLGIGNGPLGGLKAHMAEASEAAEKLGIHGAGTGKILAGALAGGALVGGAALVEFGKKGVDKFIELTAEVNQFKRVSGASAEESSKFVFALNKLGVSAETGAAAVSKLARLDPAKLHAFGVEVARNADGSENLTETLLNVADAYAKTTDPAKRAQLAFAAFGKQGLALTPVLAKGREGLKEFFAEADKTHQVFSQKDLDQARDYRMSIKDLHETITGLEIEVGQRAVPALTQYTQNLTGIAEAVDALAHKAPGLGDKLKYMLPLVQLKAASGVVPGLARHFGLLAEKSKDAGDAQGELGTAEQKTTAAGEAQTKSLENQQKALDDVRTATYSLFRSDIAAREAMLDVRDSVKDYSKALDANHRAKGHNKDAAEALTRAEDALRLKALDAADAAAKEAQDHAQARGKTLDSAAADRIKIDTLRRLADKYPALRKWAQGYSADLQRLGRQNPRPKITLDAKAADAKLRAEEIAFANSPLRRGIDVPITITAHLQGNAVNAVGPTTIRDILGGGIRSGHGTATIHPHPNYHAAGGTFRAGDVMTVGERGKETVVATTNGRIYPTGSAPWGAGSQPTVAINFYGPVIGGRQQDMVTLANALAVPVGDALRRQGRIGNGWIGADAGLGRAANLRARGGG